jgi:hypothetical protein
MDVIQNGRRFSAFLGATAVAVTLAATGAGAAALTVPVNQSIPVALTQTVTSQTAQVGDPFTFATTKDVKLGTLTLPKGTPGHGRLAVVTVAHGKSRGGLALQADSLDLPDGSTIWVNIDASKPPKGRLADKHTKPLFLPLPIGIGGGYTTTTSGNMILDKGTTFSVLTIAPRAAPAPLLTATPTPIPTLSPTPSSQMKKGAPSPPPPPSPSASPGPTTH